MTPQAVTNALWSYAVFDLRPPRAVVAAAAPLADRFNAEGLRQLFHAHLAETAAGRRLDLPAGLFARARSLDGLDGAPREGLHRRGRRRRRRTK